MHHKGQKDAAITLVEGDLKYTEASEISQNGKNVRKCEWLDGGCTRGKLGSGLSSRRVIIAVKDMRKTYCPDPS